MRPRESLFALAFMASWLACGGDDLVAPTPGEIVVTVSTSGEEPDADGYTVTLDGQLAATLEPNGTTSLTAPEGDHTVDLGGLAANCSVAAGVSRSVRVVAAQETPVAFDVVCVSTAGGLKVNIVTTGPQQDADGYAVQVDGGDPQAIDPNASVTLTALPAGNHVVGLLEVAENCVVSGDNPRSVAVVAGEIIEIVFELACIATLGGISISTSTTGSGTDEDGYTARVDEGPEQPIGLNGTLLVAGIAPGIRNISLGSVAANCVVEGDNPRAVEVPAGDPVAVEFRVSCTSGVRQWTAMASNTDADLPDVWGSSASDVFVVGELPVDANDDVASVILHFDGTTWTPIFTETNLMLRAVWGSSGTDVYAAGFDFAGDARMLRFDGTRWSDLPGFTAGSLEEISLASVWGSSASDIFAVGTAIDGVERRSLVFHYDGIGWQRMPVTSRVAPGLMDVWGSSPTDVYAVGRDAGARTGVIMHYDGTGWSPVLEQTDLLLNAVWGTADDDVYAGGFRVDEDFNVTGTILHFDGSDWSDVDLPPSDVINELWASSADDVFAVGAGGAVLHFDGAGWTKTNPTTTDLLGIWGHSASDVFAVGLMGTILRGTP